MKIELGKTYSVSNKYKKTFVEDNFLTSTMEGMPSFDRITVWRSGTIKVTPIHEYEVEYLQEMLDAGDDCDNFDFDEFEEVEFDSSWDGYSEEYESGDAENLAKVEELIEEYESLEEDDYFDFISYAEEKYEYDYEEVTYCIEGPIVVELVELD